MNRADPCRFCRLYATCLPIFALLLGAATALPYLIARGAGGAGILFSSLRSTAPMASGTALLLALVLWGHPLSLEALQRDLPRISWRAGSIAAPGYGVAAALALAANFAVALALGHDLTELRGWLSQRSLADVGVGALATALDTALIVVLTRRYAARLHAARLSLPAQLIVVVTVTVPLRATAALILASLGSA